jgi:hypothetical protein
VNVVYAHEYSKGIPYHSIFLAGPSPRAATHYNWRLEALQVLEDAGYGGEVYVPLPRDGNWLTDYDAQVEWELHYLNAAQCIAFWIPRDLDTLPGFTTNVEFGLFAHTKKVILGAPEGAPKTRYLYHIAKRYKIPVFNQLSDITQAMRISSWSRIID